MTSRSKKYTVTVERLAPKQSSELTTQCVLIDTYYSPDAEYTPKSLTRRTLERLFLDSTYTIDFFNKIFIIAINKHDIETIEILLENKKVNPYVGNNKAVMWATSKGYWQIIRLILLFEETIEFNLGTNNNEAIFIASMGGHTKVVKELLSSKYVNPADSNNRAILVAFGNKHIDVVKLLIPVIDMHTIFDLEIHKIATDL